jgi:arabinogalactan endo-1,4-beta-galactosidase
VGPGAAPAPVRTAPPPPAGGGGGRPHVEDTLPPPASFWVERVPGLTDDFARGLDISPILSVEQTGVVFKDANGTVKDVFDILAEAGVNSIRIRVWNDPYFRQWDLEHISEYFSADALTAAGVGESWIGKPYGAGICDVPTVKAIAQRIADSNARTGKKVGMLIDFHYSDFWADPERQTAPKSWMDMDVAARKAAIKAFTLDSLRDFASTGAPITGVQIGNEINHGVAGFDYEEDSDNNGKADAFDMLISASEGVRTFNPNTKVVVHYTDPQELDGHYNRVQALIAAGVDFDVLGTSFYTPGHGIIPQLRTELAKVQALGYGVMVVETGAGGDQDGGGISHSPQNEWAYPSSWQGQAQNIRDTIAALVDMGATGYYIWNPISLNASDRTWTVAKFEDIGYPSFTKYVAAYDPNSRTLETGSWGLIGGIGSSSFFSNGTGPLPFGMAFPSLSVFKYLVTGSIGDYPMFMTNTATLIQYADLQSAPNKKALMPSTAKVTYTSGKKADALVSWRDVGETITEGWTTTTYHGMNDVTEIGEYIVIGDALVDGIALTVTCAVSVRPAQNYVINPGFEDADWTENWTVQKSPDNVARAERWTSNVHGGSFGFTFENGEAQLNVTVTQRINLEAGTYHLSVYAMGANAGVASGHSFTLFVAKDGGEDINSTTMSLIGWPNFIHPSVDFTLDAPATLAVGVRIVAPNGGMWGTLDDFMLWKE